MQNNKRFKAAIIGCGRIASDFDDDPLMKKNYGISSHAGGYADNHDIELIAASDVSIEKLEKFGAKWGVSRLYHDYREMLAKEEIDMLSICTWNSTHLEILKSAADAKIKAVFCEKPISNSLENADKMLSVITQSGMYFQVNHARRWDELYADIKKYIFDGKLGDVQQVSCYYTAGLANSCSHLFDVLRMFFGEVAGVSAWIKGDRSVDDPNIDGYVKFSDGITATVQSLNVKDYTIFEFDIYGTKGRIRIRDNGFGIDYWIANPSERYMGYRELSHEPSPINVYPKNMMKNAVKNIVDGLNNGKAPACSADDGLKSLEIICAFRLSADKNGVFVELPLKNRRLLIKSK